MIGCLVVVCSVAMLPWIVVSPGSVANLFNLGALIIMASFVIFYGIEEFKRRFLAGNQKAYAIGFIVALVLCFYFSFSGSYFMTIVLLVAEYILIAYYIACYFPGGREGVTHMLKAFWSYFQACFKKQTERM